MRPKRRPGSRQGLVDRSHHVVDLGVTTRYPCTCISLFPFGYTPWVQKLVNHVLTVLTLGGLLEMQSDEGHL